jgi:hypothetical protein
MLKFLAIILIALIVAPLATVGILSAQSTPTGTPKERVTKPGTSQHGQEQTGTSEGDQKPQCVPSHHALTFALVHDGASEQASENLKIQRQLALFTFLLVVVGFLQAATMIRQAGLLRGTLDKISIQATHMEQQTGLLETSRKQTEKIIESMTDTATKQLRAYVLVDSAHLSFGNTGIPRAQVNIKNFGQTPARDLRGWYGAHRALRSPRVILQPPTDDIQMGTQVLGPGNEAIFAGDFPYAVTRIDDPPNAAIYVYGELAYTDAFGNAHTTKYRMFVETSGKASRATDAKGNLVQFSLKMDSWGNEAS